MARISRRISMAIGVIAATLLAAACASLPTSEGDYQWYSSAEALWQASDLVIEATIGPDPSVDMIQIALALPGQTLPPDELEGDVFTIHRAEVTQAWRGTAHTGQVVEVKQPGGEYEGVSHPGHHEQTDLEPGGTYLLFLETYEEMGVPASPLNPVQGFYRLGDDGQPQPLPRNDVPVSLADLADLVDQAASR